MMMEIVVKIEEKIFEELTKYDKPVPSGNRLYDSVLLSIYNGIPLPENHGDLKDVNDIWNNIPDVNTLTNNFTTYDIQHFIDNAPTIIEAEKE